MCVTNCVMRGVLRLCSRLPTYIPALQPEQGIEGKDDGTEGKSTECTAVEGVALVSRRGIPPCLPPCPASVPPLQTVAALRSTCIGLAVRAPSLLLWLNRSNCSWPSARCSRCSVHSHAGHCSGAHPGGRAGPARCDHPRAGERPCERPLLNCNQKRLVGELDLLFGKTPSR